MIGAAVGLLLGWWWFSRRRRWHPIPLPPTSPVGAVPTVLPTSPEGWWWEGTGRLWYAPHGGPLRDYGLGELQCGGDQVQWLGPHATVWFAWENILAVHEYANGLLFHTRDLSPLVLTVTDPTWGRLVTYWRHFAWEWDGTAWRR